VTFNHSILAKKAGTEKMRKRAPLFGTGHIATGTITVQYKKLSRTKNKQLTNSNAQYNYWKEKNTQFLMN